MEFDDKALDTLLQVNPCQTTQELATQFKCSHMTVNRHLHALGMVNKYVDSVPRQLSTDNLAQRVSICRSLLSRHHRDPFLERIVTGDEKWVHYINIRRRRQWLDLSQKPLPDVKANLHPEKIMLCIWWDIEGVIYFKLLETNQTITADFYSQQLQRVHEALFRKQRISGTRDNVILLHLQHTRQILYRQTITCFDPFKTIYATNNTKAWMRYNPT